MFKRKSYHTDSKKAFYERKKSISREGIFSQTFSLKYFFFSPKMLFCYQCDNFFSQTFFSLRSFIFSHVIKT